jgi:alpha-mannosidase
VELRLPALGYTTLIVRAAPTEAPFTRHPVTPGLATSHRSMRNESIDVSVEPNGTLTVTDLRTREIYDGLMTFEDAADIGDGWFHGPPVNDEIWTSASASAEVALIADGPLLSRLRVVVTLLLPERFDAATQARSTSRVPLVLDTIVTLRRGAHRVEIETTVTNTASDHRLRMLFPTRTAADTYLADTPFDVVERSIALRLDNHLNRELETETKPQQSWTAVNDGRRGLAIVAPDLSETAVRDLPDRSLALTLLRATGRTAFTYREPEGQLLGRRLTFRSWLVPLAQVDRVELAESAQALAGGHRVVQLASADAAIHRRPTALPTAWSFAELRGDAVLTSLREVGDGFEIRLINPHEYPTTVTLRPPVGIGPGIGLVDFESRPLGDAVAVNPGGEIALDLPAKRVVTLRLGTDYGGSSIAA